jgi:hypothetical protein
MWSYFPLEHIIDFVWLVSTVVGDTMQPSAIPTNSQESEDMIKAEATTPVN